jgi:hypothetical protein
MLKKIFTPEVLGNAAVTLVVVMVALAAHDKFVRPRLSGNGSTPAPAPAPKADESAE